MIDKRLKDWVEEDKAHRSLTINFGLTKYQEARVFVATFELGECVGTSITDANDITGQLIAVKAKNDREQYETLKAKFGGAA